jgi:glycosyltransferase involved in cell wall biosynthesis
MEKERECASDPNPSFYHRPLRPLPAMPNRPSAGPTVSAVIITRDEAANLPACLESLAWCDEIVVLDSGSTDATPELARAAGARVHISPDWPGFGPQKNRALALAGCDWVLSIDADERVSPELAREIREAVRAPGAPAAFAMPRLSSYCGQFMRHGDWYPDDVLRLFRRGSARFSDDLVHERLLVDGPRARLRARLLHHSFRDMHQVLAKLDAYSSAGARAMHARGRRSGVLGALGHGAWTFLRGYVFKRGFLDGRLGLVLALSNAHGAYYRYIKLWLLQREPAC